VRADYNITPQILTLLHYSFADMKGRIDPPSSLKKLTVDAINHHMETEVLLTVQNASTPIACVFLTEQSDAIYLGKLAVAETHRKTGAAKALINWAETYTRDQGHRTLRLQTRIELTENHALFAHLGFTQTATGKHPGFTHPTEITMEKPV